jgi:acrylyl-CoA reductase (NADPH)
VSESFRALVVSENEGATSQELRRLAEAELDTGDVTVAVEYSSLNYKDGLAVSGRGRVVRRFPMVPGIDLAGRVLRSDTDDFAEGDRVLATGCGLGERHFGGYAERARLPAAWLVPIPDALTTKRAMAIGTAGFTAMLSLMALEEHSVQPSDDQPILVTGAAGGVGSVAACGLAAAAELPTTVMPFILRGVNLLGIDSNTCPRELRLRAWQRLAAELPGGTIDRITTTIPLEDVARAAEDILAGRVHGRTVVDLSG